MLGEDCTSNAAICPSGTTCECVPFSQIGHKRCTPVPPRFSYDPPIVDKVTIEGLNGNRRRRLKEQDHIFVNTTGGTSEQFITVTGENFGAAPTLWWVTSEEKGGDCTVDTDCAGIGSEEHGCVGGRCFLLKTDVPMYDFEDKPTGSLFRFLIPPGFGTTWEGVIDAGMQRIKVKDLTVSYNPPILDPIKFVDGERPTEGGFTIRLTGANLGASQPTDGDNSGVWCSKSTCESKLSLVLYNATTFEPIFQDGVPLHNCVFNHTTATCTALAGFGKNLDLWVVIGGQRSNTLDFSFDRPEVTELSRSSVSLPYGEDEVGDEISLTIRGKNFGGIDDNAYSVPIEVIIRPKGWEAPSTSDQVVTYNQTTSPRALWKWTPTGAIVVLDHGLEKTSGANTSKLVVGTKQVLVVVGGQRSESLPFNAAGETLTLDIVCRSGYSAMLNISSNFGEPCAKCMPGATCRNDVHPSKVAYGKLRPQDYDYDRYNFYKSMSALDPSFIAPSASVKEVALAAQLVNGVDQVSNENRSISLSSLIGDVFKDELELERGIELEFGTYKTLVENKGKLEVRGRYDRTLADAAIARLDPINREHMSATVSALGTQGGLTYLSSFNFPITDPGLFLTQVDVRNSRTPSLLNPDSLECQDGHGLAKVGAQLEIYYNSSIAHPCTAVVQANEQGKALYTIDGLWLVPDDDVFVHNVRKSDLMESLLDHYPECTVTFASAGLLRLRWSGILSAATKFSDAEMLRSDSSPAILPNLIQGDMGNLRLRLSTEKALPASCEFASNGKNSSCLPSEAEVTLDAADGQNELAISFNPGVESGEWTANVTLTLKSQFSSAFFHQSGYSSVRTTCLRAETCYPDTSCLGANWPDWERKEKDSYFVHDNCNTGYQGVRCAYCISVGSPQSEGGFYRYQGECIPCPDQPWLIAVMMLVGGLVICAFGYLLSKKKMSLGIIAIGVDYAQVLAIFSGAKVQWPPELVEIYRVLSAFNFNIDLVAPECWAPDFEYWEKWAAMESIPLVLFSLIVVMWVLETLFGKFLRRHLTRNRSRKGAQRDALVGLGVVGFYYGYLFLVRASLEIFNCVTTKPDDGKTYLSAAFPEECCTPAWPNDQSMCPSTASMQRTLQPWAILTFALYAVGYPLFVGIVMWRYGHLAKEDQLLRALHKGDSAASNPNCWAFRQRYARMYYHFKPGKVYWSLVILMRKFGLAVIALWWRDYPTFQLSLAALLMFVSFGLQLKHRPYMSMSEHDGVVNHFKEKVKALEDKDKEQADDLMKGSSMSRPILDPSESTPKSITASVTSVYGAIKHIHERQRTSNERDLKVIKVHLKKVEADSAKTGHLSLRLFDRSKDELLTQLGRETASFVTNYNTVEAVMLFCAVLVNLAGIMLESDFVVGKDTSSTTSQMLTAGVCIVIFGSLTYWFAVLFAEVKCGFFPQVNNFKVTAVVFAAVNLICSGLGLSLCGWVLVEEPNTAGVLSQVEVGLWGTCTKEDVPTVSLLVDSRIEATRAFAVICVTACSLNAIAVIIMLLSPARMKDDLRRLSKANAASIVLTATTFIAATLSLISYFSKSVPFSYHSLGPGVAAQIVLVVFSCGAVVVSIGAWKNPDRSIEWRSERRKLGEFNEEEADRTIEMQSQFKVSINTLKPKSSRRYSKHFDTDPTDNRLSPKPNIEMVSNPMRSPRSPQSSTEIEMMSNPLHGKPASPKTPGTPSEATHIKNAASPKDSFARKATPKGSPASKASPKGPASKVGPKGSAASKAIKRQLSGSTTSRLQTVKGPGTKPFRSPSSELASNPIHAAGALAKPPKRKPLRAQTD